MMKRHRTTTMNRGMLDPDGPGVMDQPRRVRVEPDPPAGEAAAGEFVLTSVDTWNHTLILSGELTHRSAHALEVEIERLCEEGVTDITLDLRELTAVDPVGVAVIAFRCGLCEKRGYGFRLIRGVPLVQRAFEQAGVLGMLPFQEGDGPTPAHLGAVAHRSLDAVER
jgi:anti-anti-sigma factor